MISFLVIFIIIILSGIFFYREPSDEWKHIKYGIISPCYGTISNIYKCEEFTRIDWFLSLWDIHKQIVPYSGVVESVTRIPGKYKLAFLKDSEEKNERVYTILNTDRGRIMICQKAGFFTRKIDNYLTPGQRVEIGEPLGWIHFGSGISLWIPRRENYMKFRCLEKKLN